MGKGLLLELLLMANYKDTRAVRQSKVIIVNRGQILTSIVELSQKLQVSRKMITIRLEILEQLGTITLKRDSLGTIITIQNFSKYQDMETESGTTKEQRRNSEGYSEGTAKVTRIEELKEIKEINKGEELGQNLPPPVDKFLNSYCDEMQKVYGRRPRKTSNLKRLASQIISEVGLERSIALAGQFCASNRDYYIKRAHSLEVLLKDLAIIDMFA
jgi:DNA-binding transcriptional regulator YhcF (GntR family)